jgi:hypothetical protein
VEEAVSFSSGLASSTVSSVLILCSFFIRFVLVTLLDLQVSYNVLHVSGVVAGRRINFSQSTAKNQRAHRTVEISIPSPNFRLDIRSTL